MFWYVFGWMSVVDVFGYFGGCLWWALLTFWCLFWMFWWMFLGVLVDVLASGLAPGAWHIMVRLRFFYSGCLATGEESRRAVASPSPAGVLSGLVGCRHRVGPKLS